VRERKLAFDHSEYWPDVEYISAPIYDETGKIVLAISITQPKSRLTHDKINQEMIAITKFAG
jgi:DNA-binding IclR family transcriptional regulator